MACSFIFHQFYLQYKSNVRNYKIAWRVIFLYFVLRYKIFFLIVTLSGTFDVAPLLLLGLYCGSKKILEYQAFHFEQFLLLYSTNLDNQFYGHFIHLLVVIFFLHISELICCFIWEVLCGRVFLCQILLYHYRVHFVRWFLVSIFGQLFYIWWHISFHTCILLFIDFFFPSLTRTFKWWYLVPWCNLQIWTLLNILYIYFSCW